MSDINLRVRQAIEAFKAGEMVVVTDDDDRENEGDLIVAAVHCTTEHMAFIVRHTSGIVCAPLSAEENCVQFAETVEFLVNLLDSNHREIFLMRLDGKSNKEIADHIRMTIATVERRFKRIRKQIHEADISL